MPEATGPVNKITFTTALSLYGIAITTDFGPMLIIINCVEFNSLRPHDNATNHFDGIVYQVELAKLTLVVALPELSNV